MNQPVYVAPNRKGIPYGMMNFAAIRREGDGDAGVRRSVTKDL